MVVYGWSTGYLSAVAGSYEVNIIEVREVPYPLKSTTVIHAAIEPRETLINKVQSERNVDAMEKATCIDLA